MMFEIRYQIEEGYCGGSRPQYCYIDGYEIEDMTEEDLKNYFWDTIQEDMISKVYAVSSMEEEFIEWAKKGE